LLVVNNNSTDETDAVLSRYSDRLPLRRLFEPRQGKSYACNQLVQEATGELLLWADDDVLVDPDWLGEYVAAAARFPDAGFFGGRVDPWYESPPTEWVQRNFALVSHGFALCQYEGTLRPILPEENPIGANMAFRLEVLRQYPFDPRLGKTAKQKGWCEDTELIDRMRKDGIAGVWVGTARVRHWVPTERMTYKYFWDWNVGMAAILVRRNGLPDGVYWCGMPRWRIRRWIMACLTWSAARLFGDESQRVAACRQWAMETGILSECRRQSREKAASGPCAVNRR
jgi:glycosyltransferase involved in cell wall biosynthesis